MVQISLKVFPDAKMLAEAAAQAVAETLALSLQQFNAAWVILAGGSTPEATYRLLAEEPYRSRLAWEKLGVFFGDERGVASDHALSNFRMANEALLSRVPLPAEAVHRIQAELGVEKAAEVYQDEIRRATTEPWPRFDLLVLGMGADGHTASLFPGSLALTINDALVTFSEAPQEPRSRVTLTLRALNSARSVVFLVAGVDKAGALAQVLGGGDCQLPAARVKPRRGQVAWFVDEAAASRLAPARIEELRG